MKVRVAVLVSLIAILVVVMIALRSANQPPDESAGTGTLPPSILPQANVPFSYQHLEVDVDSSIVQEDALSIAYMLRSRIALDSMKEDEVRSGVFAFPDAGNPPVIVEFTDPNGQSTPDAEHHGSWLLRRRGGAFQLVLSLF